MSRKMLSPRLAWLAATLLMAASVLIPAAAAQAAPLQQSSGGADPGDEIVYIDGNDGYIRVLDTVMASGAREVRWVSPEADWREIALGDFNNDGDMEIVAIKGRGGSSKLVIYDPVLASASSVEDGKINEIPWAKLYEMSLPDAPLIVAAGDFDAGVPGDEFLVGFEVQPGGGQEDDDFFKMQIWKQTSQTPTGRNWVVHVDNKYTEERYDRIAVGQYIPGGTDEFAVVDADGDNPGGGEERYGKMEIYRVDTGWARIHSLGDTGKNVQEVAFGQWDSGGSEEAAILRAGSSPTSLLVWEFDEDDPEEAREVKAEYFYPDPRRVAYADVDGDDEDEIFMLRSVPEGSGLARLIGRNKGEGSMTEWEEELDDNNDWRSIAGGDLDADGKDELIIARAATTASSSDVIRVYRNAASTTGDEVDYPARNNRRTLLTGNLDAIGFTEGPVFAVDKTQVELTVAAGDTAQVTVRLRNATTTAAVPFSVTTERRSPWLQVTPTSGSTPANNVDTTLTLTFSARDLSEGIYRERVLIDSSVEVANAPLSVIITLNVTPAAFFASPAVLYLPQPSGTLTETIQLTLPCTDTTLITQSLPIQVYGTEGITYTAAILDTPTFAAAASKLGGMLNGAAIDDDGALVLTNPNGEWVALPEAYGFSPAEVRASAVLSETWPSGVPWLSAESETGVTPDTLMVNFDRAALGGTGEQSAMIVLLADPRAGSQPNNARFVQVFACTNVTMLPTVTH